MMSHMGVGEWRYVASVFHEGNRGMARIHRGMARVNRGMARQINLKNRDKGIQKTKNIKKVQKRSAVKKFSKKKKFSKEVQ